MSVYWKGFEDDEPVQCELCHNNVTAGDDYYTYKDMCFCSISCIGEYLAEEHDDEIKRHHLETAFEKEMVVADREIDRRRDEGLW
jgi:hypothetical protein